ncbi:RNA-directed DNA polymerase, eukaryota, reverse transcriptase zinc-binding domain protein [Tanacetum coccineum]
MSNASMLERLSCNIFITNFPAYFSSKDLWNTCSKFGTVLDLFIPSKLSKQSKRYAFARFKKVSNVDSLISNLRSVWLGSFHLYANVARFNRDTKTSDAQNSHSNVPLNTSKPSYAKVLGKKESPQNHDEPVIVLEEGMLNFEGEPVLLSPWSPHFEVQNRIVWIDVEGIPLRAWSKTTFNKIARKWGELVFTDDSNSANKLAKRIGGIEEGEINPESVQNDAFIDNIVESEPNNRDSREKIIWSAYFEAFKSPLGGSFWARRSHLPFDIRECRGFLRASTPPQDSKKVRNDQTFHQVLEESVNKSSGVSKTAHADSMAGPVKQRNGFSILERFQEFIDIGQAMGYEMKGWLGGVKKKQWVKKLCHSNQVNFLSIQETKMVSFDVFVIKNLWGNMLFDFATSLARGRSGEGTWMANNADLLFISVYFPQELSLKRVLWNYMLETLNRWHGEVIIMGDFNEARKEQLLMFKVDFQKAFNSVRWDHLDDILGKFGFGNKWRGWIRGCLQSSKASVLVSGSPTDEFSFHRGLRQGDALSPFLFILVMESLHVSFQRLIDRATFFFYLLGLKVGANMMRLNSWSDVVKKVSNKLSNWKAKTLSVGGRLTLLKSVLGAIPTYYMSLFKALEGIISLLEKMRNKLFLGADTNDRKITWVCWNKVLAHKNKGGLGVNSLFALNLASIFKWIWRFLASSLSLWIKVIKSIHGNSGALDNPYSSRLRNSTWIGILKAINKLKVKGVDLMGFCKIVIGNGSTTRFWHDIWYGDICFKEKFKRLFNLELQKDANVASKLQASNVASSFRRPPRSGIENSQFIELEQILSSISLSSVSDRWSWTLHGLGDFSVKSAREEIDKHVLVVSPSQNRWSKVLPIKLNVFSWRMMLDRLPTRSNLYNRGINITCILCPNCGAAIENRNHLFFGCSMSVDLARLIGRWWNIHIPIFDDPSSWDSWFNGMNLSSMQRRILEATFVSMWWHIWKFRNLSIFSSKKPRKERIFDDIVSHTYFWLK